MIWPADNTVITQLRVRSTGLDPLTIRQRMTRSLSALSLQPRSLPPSTILCIRSLRDPKPGSLQWWQADARRSMEWERALAESIEKLARDASRPIDGAVPANAQAVIFRDRAELLACLAADWCAGAVTMHWWWHSLLTRRESAQAVIEAWLETPEHIPMALHWLEIKQLSVSFAERLSEENSHQMMSSLVRTFGLDSSVEVVHTNRTGVPAGITAAEKSEEVHGFNIALNSSMGSHSPWQHWFPNGSMDHLSSDRQMLLGVGLMLRYAPAIVRTAAFTQQVKEWLTSVDRFLSSERVSEPSFSLQPGECLSSADTAALGSASKSVLPKITPRTSITKENLESQPDLFEQSESPLTIPSDFSPAIQSSPDLTAAPMISAEPDASQSILPSEASKADLELDEMEILSQFGGTFYLINLGLYLELYGDFTTPLHPGIDLPIWDFLAILAQQIFGKQVLDDPIRSLLARLAGRADDELPGLQFDPPGHLSLQAWIDDLMLTVRPRLQSALGVDESKVARFFHLAARIVVTATRLDAYFGLDDLPIEIRLSGLDRDPGWVPAAGKFIGFHYE